MSANLHPNPLSGYSEDYPDPDEADEVEDDDEPDMLCGDCGDGVYAEEAHNVEAFERFGTIVCRGCFNERCEEDGEPA